MSTLQSLLKKKKEAQGTVRSNNGDEQRGEKGTLQIEEGEEVKERAPNRQSLLLACSLNEIDAAGLESHSWSRKWCK